MKKYLIISLIAFGVVLGYVLTVIPKTKPPTAQTPKINQQSSVNEVVITYSDRGFMPATIKVKRGQTVRFISTSDIPNWVASNPHPAHTDYPGFDAATILDSLPQPGAGFTFRFEQVGTWGYHNHARPEHAGTIEVTR